MGLYHTLSARASCGIYNITSYHLQQLEILLPAHAYCTHIVFDDVNVDFFVFRDNNGSFCSGQVRIW